MNFMSIEPQLAQAALDSSLLPLINPLERKSQLNCFIKISKTTAQLNILNKEANIVIANEENPKKFSHPNIVEFKFFKEYTNYACLGMELCVGGSLSEWIQKQKLTPNVDTEKYEDQCAAIIKQILLGLQYIHDEHELIHRDIKPSNILFKDTSAKSCVKIADFGLANKVGVGFNDQNSDKVGTTIYEAPEQINGVSYGKAVDLWAVGMVIFEMVTKGSHPILGDNNNNSDKLTFAEYKSKLNSIDTKSIIKQLKYVSKLAKHLLNNLLDVRPSRRYNANRALKHPWITRNKNDSIPLNFYQEIKQKSKLVNQNDSDITKEADQNKNKQNNDIIAIENLSDSSEESIDSYRSDFDNSTQNSPKLKISKKNIKVNSVSPNKNMKHIINSRRSNSK